MKTLMAFGALAILAGGAFLLGIYAKLFYYLVREFLKNRHLVYAAVCVMGAFLMLYGYIHLLKILEWYLAGL